MSAKLFRDRAFGALAVIDTPDGIVTVDHGFDDKAFDAALSVLERHARPEFSDDGSALWRSTSHPRIVLASLSESLERFGFTADPLDSMCALDVSVEEALNPDIPTSQRPMRLNETVERGLWGHLDIALSPLRDRGDVQMVETAHLPRASKDHLGRPLFLTRARGLILKPVESAEDCQAALRAALAPVAGVVVRAVVESLPPHEATGTSRHALEIALAPGREVVEEYVSAKLPTFESDDAPIRGVRPARFVLDTMPSREDILGLEERAVACTAATAISIPNGRTVVARIPSTTVEGTAAADRAFEQRVAWLAQQLDEYGPALDYIGEVEPVLALSEDDARRELAAIRSRA